jgi:hypothetical protein
VEVSDDDQDHLLKDGLFHRPFDKRVFAERRVGEVNGIRDLGIRRRHSQVSGGSRTVFDCAAGLQVTYKSKNPEFEEFEFERFLIKPPKKPQSQDTAR